MFCGGDGFSPERRDTMCTADLGHAKREWLHWRDLDRCGQDYQPTAKCASLFWTPGTCQCPATSAHDALAQSIEIEVRRGWLMS
jgi:hypothetical protein